ncbi:MAG: hypothetical protein HQK63_16995 [Desulfamplus sp.]|nr:hypothetical protein [Desulfamplus sp.]
MKRLNYSYNMNYKLDPPDDDPPNDDLDECNDKDNEYEIDTYLYDKESEENYYDTLSGHSFSGSMK